MPSHSLLVLPFVGWLIWALLRRRWMWAIQLALLTHPLLDSFTAYGTQLLWPLPTGPMSLLAKGFGLDYGTNLFDKSRTVATIGP